MLRLQLLILILLCISAPLAADTPDTSVIVVTNRDHILPIGKLADRSIAMVTLGSGGASEFEDYCCRYAMIDVERIASHDDLWQAYGLAEDTDLLIIAICSSQPWVRDAAKTLFSLKPSIAVYFLPYKEIASFASCGRPAATVIADPTALNIGSLAAQTIFGGRAAQGRLPQTIRGIGDKGRGISFHKTRLGYTSPECEGFSSGLEKRIDSIVAYNIANRSFPGCQIVVARKGNIVIDKAYGTYGFDNPQKIQRSTLFDIASMTKATATVAGLMKAYDQKLFRLDRPLTDYTPKKFQNGGNELTVRDFLFHETGFPASVFSHSFFLDPSSYSGKLFSSHQDQQYSVKVEKGTYANSDARLNPEFLQSSPSKKFCVEIARDVFACDSMIDSFHDGFYSVSPRGRTYLYSDLNFCLLKDLEEAVTGEPHDKWVDNEIFLPLGAHSTTFCPVSNGWDATDAAPTERDSFLRHQLLQGYVHDETAAFLGGVSGNAGLFSTAGDIAKLCQTWLNGGTYGDVSLFSPQTVKLFTSTRSSAGRALGFDLAGRVRSYRDTGINPHAFGHTGFTGTCFWVDPDEDIIIVILTNRVNPTRDTPTFNKLNPRQDIIRAVYTSIPSRLDNQNISE